MQYDLGSPDPMNNEQIIASGSPAFGSMQLGPNGMLYAARLNGATYLSEITDPDVVGTGCNFMSNGASLGSDVSTWGLPDHWDTYPTPAPVDLIPWTDSLVCSGAGVLIETNWQHPFHVPTYLWSTGETTASIVANDPGTYSVEVFLPCSILTDTVNIAFGGVPFTLGEDVSMCDGDVLELSVPVSTGVLWSTGDTTASITVSEQGAYGASITDTDGCVSYDEVVVSTRNCDCPVYFPNAVTPNGDGNNDRFAPVMDCEPVAYSMELFDRWGQLLYASQDPFGSWDPSDVPLGVYVYRVNYSWIDRSGIRTDARFGHITVVK
jgi:gliding motility-associated-like protein